MNQFTCGVCGQTKTHDSKYTTGYGTKRDGTKVCYECCGKEDAEYMRTHDRITLYLTERKSYDSEVGNWPGSLKFKAGYVKRGSHNIAGTRRDVWFTGPDGSRWWGVQYGDNTQILHCRKLKGA
jgi:hypothetical protein